MENEWEWFVMLWHCTFRKRIIFMTFNKGWKFLFHTAPSVLSSTLSHLSPSCFPPSFQNFLFFYLDLSLLLSLILLPFLIFYFSLFILSVLSLFWSFFPSFLIRSPPLLSLSYTCSFSPLFFLLQFFLSFPLSFILRSSSLLFFCVSFSPPFSQ